MNMEELLGLDAGDFEGVEFAESSDSDNEQDTSSGGRMAAAETNDSTSGEDGTVAAPPPAAPASSTVTTVMKPRDSTPVGSGRITDGDYSFSPSSSSPAENSEAAVDVERGTPLPEHACLAKEGEGTATSTPTAAAAANLSLLTRIERCCLESRPSEIEATVAALSSYLGTGGGGGDAGDDSSREKQGSADATGASAAGVSNDERAVAMACAKMMPPVVAKPALAACRAALRLCRGEYEELLRETALFSTPDGHAKTGNNSSSSIQESVRAFVVGGDPAAAVWRAAEATWAGAAALNLFLQENYAGPELGDERTEAITAWFSKRLTGTYGGGGEGNGSASDGGNGSAAAAQDLANIALACDGELPYPKSSLPGSLVAARTILTAVAGTGVTQNDSVSTVASPEGSRPLSVWSADGSSAAAVEEDASFQSAVSLLSSPAWWSARACVTHARLLISSSGRSDTLWREARGLFGRAVGLFGGGVGGPRGMSGTEDAGAGGGVDAGQREAVARRVSGQVWLEWGLAQHHFQDPTKGKESFARAKEASGLTAGLTGALGKRTKYQQSQIAQLVLVASSATTPVMAAPNSTDDESAAPPPPLPGAEAVDGAGTGVVAPPAGPELGMSTSVGAEGRRAAARQTLHGADSALLEDISFVQRDLENPGKLQDVDLAIILGLCLDVSNSNPRDGLTNEQMTPYIARVLRQPGCNWMIYSTALLQRAWVEFERSHARERAALQLQALLDQHTTKLTYMQSTAATIEDSAPVEDRLRFLCSLSFPPRWELRRDLARRYAGMGVLGSAAAEFVDLEMWEEAVECYRQMQQVHKAEKIARERLKEKETPPMLAALGDLTQDPECWQRAWDLSGGRYARAKTSLARMRFAEGKHEEACGHYEQALSVKPLLPAAWFSLGVARMRLGRWQEALQAFSTVAQQEPEEGEAWGNIGAVHMHEGNWAGAAAAFTQGLKQMPSNWRMWENQAEALIRLKRWSSAAYACHRMLDLSDKSKRGVDADFLAVLVEGALKQEPLGSFTPSGMSASSAAAAAEMTTPAEGSTATPEGGTRTGEAASGGGGGSGKSGDDLTGRPLCKQVAELLGRVVSATSTRGDARVWEVYARFNDGAGRDRSRVLDCVTKQCRALQQSGWEKDAAAVLRLASASDKLVELYLEDGKRQSAYQAKMHLATLARKVKAADAVVGCPGHERLYTLLHTVEGVLAELKEKEAAAVASA